MTFADKPPTEPGFYAWKSNENQSTPNAATVEIYKGEVHAELSFYFGPVTMLGGLWCRLVPAEEVAAAFEEGRCQNFGWGCPWHESRARRVAEGKEP